MLGTPQDALQISVTLLTVLGQSDREILLQTYSSLLQPMRVPELGAGSQPQQVLLWLRTAFVARMEVAERIGMSPAMLTWLMLMQGIPVGKGDMAHVFSEVRAQSEGLLSSGEEKSRDDIMAFIDHELLRPLGAKRWTGSWKHVPQPAGAIAAYVAEAEKSSSRAQSPEVSRTPRAAHTIDSAQQHGPSPAHARGVCRKWQTKGCKADQCCNGYEHPNGKRQCSPEDRACSD
jgi:hypothetical protein